MRMLLLRMLLLRMTASSFMEMLKKRRTSSFMEMLIWMGPPVDNAVVDVEEEDQLVHGDVDLDGPTC